MGAAGWVPGGTAVQTAAIPLQRLAAEKGLVFGSCLALKYCAQSAAYQQLFLSQCDIATPELHMKWNSLSSQSGIYNFINADKFVTFCATNRIRVRGHTLVWHDALPTWVAQQLTAESGRAMIADHIAKVAGHFAGKAASCTSNSVMKIFIPRRANWLRKAS